MRGTLVKDVLKNYFEEERELEKKLHEWYLIFQNVYLI